MNVTIRVPEAFDDFIFDWDYERYLCVGGYGSGKSYQAVIKIVLKLFQEKRKALVLREYYESMRESCFDLFSEVLDAMSMLAADDEPYCKTKVVRRRAPMQFKFPNGSRIIFKGMDSTDKVKSINGVSIVWMEEANEIKYSGWKEIQGRIRTPDQSMHFILTCNPVGKESWIYTHFFTTIDDRGKETVIMPEEKFYGSKGIICRGTYYHHSTVDDNPWAPKEYIKRLDAMKNYDYSLYVVARFGKFGATGRRVLPQFQVARDPKVFKYAIDKLGPANMYFGMDFGFETSYNAVLCMSVDPERQILYIWDEVYINQVTDDVMANLPEMRKVGDKVKAIREEGVLDKLIIADNEDPKAVRFYYNQGYPIRSCHNKFQGSRLSNTRKMKRFTKIVCSPKCKNTIRELKYLTYKVDRNGNTIYDQFTIDPHTFSAAWYGLEQVELVDLKKQKWNSKDGKGRVA